MASQNPNTSTSTDEELKTYLKHIYGIYQLVIELNKDNTNNKNNIINISVMELDTNVDKGPTLNHKELHLESYQKQFHGNEYAPILISKQFSELYTNTGILKMDNINNINITGKNKKTLIDKLNLKIYNNKYFYIDLPYSFNYLENHYKLDTISNEWVSIINK